MSTEQKLQARSNGSCELSADCDFDQVCEEVLR